MATTPKALYHGQPGNTASTLYTVPSATVAIVRHIRVVNKDTSSHDIELWLGGSADANAVIPKITVPASSTWEDDVYMPMAAAQTLQGKSSAATTLTVFVGGAEIT